LLRLTWFVSAYPPSYISIYKSITQVSGSRYLSSFPLLHILSTPSQYFTGAKVLAGGAPFYDVYACKNGGFVSVGCLEPQFFKAFIERFVREVEGGRERSTWIPSPETQMDFADWPRMRRYLTDGFKTQERNYWGTLFHGTCCFMRVDIFSNTG
jgi:alpha-methylacyl-CoA racemase